MRTQCWRCRCLYLRTLWRNNSWADTTRLGLQVRVFTSHTNESSHSNSFQGIHICPLLIHDWSKKYPNPSTQTPASFKILGLGSLLPHTKLKNFGTNLDTYRTSVFRVSPFFGTSTAPTEPSNRIPKAGDARSRKISMGTMAKERVLLIAQTPKLWERTLISWRFKLADWESNSHGAN